MKRPVFALIDCNNFFVACEKVFRPDLEGKPVVVLSSNDGCVVARSAEVRALGIPMGAPAFKWRQVFEQHHIVKFSANFDLYGDISRRITQILTTITPRIEIYSVDESFLDLSQLDIADYIAWGKHVKAAIQQWVGIPVSIGIASSKTLAKLASERAKKIPELEGVLDLTEVNSSSCQHHLENTPIKDVWGVGRRLAPKLRAEGVGNAWQLRNMRPQHAQQLLGIHGRHMIVELQGISCLPLELEGKPAKSIAATRTFGSDTNNLYVIEAAIATFTARATFKLRVDHQLTRRVSLFMTTDKHKPGYRGWSKEIILQTPSADTGRLTQLLVNALRQLYLPGIMYHRAGVSLYDFLPDHQLQVDLLGVVNPGAHERAVTRMAAVDAINKRYGKRRIHLAAEDLGDTWEPKHQLRSPRYTSNWNELPTVRIYP